MTSVLIIDDDADILSLLRLEFEDDPGCSADTTPDAGEALDLARLRTYDLIVTDWRMPGMNGTELVAALRRQGCTSPIVIYSGKERDREIGEALGAGADGYVGRRGDPEKEFSELKAILTKSGIHT